MLFQCFKWEWKWKCDIKTGGWSNVPSECECESVISKQEVVPRCSKVIQGSQVEGNHWTEGGVHPLIIRGPATQSLHRCTPYNIYSNYEVFSDFSCCWKKLCKSTSSPNARAADPNFILPLHVSVHPSWAIFLSRLWLLCFHFRSPCWEIALNHYSSPFEDFEVSVITF